jgi:hypothetical protein
MLDSSTRFSNRSLRAPQIARCARLESLARARLKSLARAAVEERPLRAA